MKSVFITGAGSGMGREGAKLFHAKGWRVGAVDRNGDGRCVAWLSGEPEAPPQMRRRRPNHLPVRRSERAVVKPVITRLDADAAQTAPAKSA